jgi:ribonuclease Z
MELDDVTIEGTCIGSQGTNIRLPQQKLMWDIGCWHPRTTAIPLLLITHGHPDHAGAITQYLFQRKIQNLPPPTIMGSPELLPVLQEITALYASLHHSQYPANYLPLEPYQRTPLPGGGFIEAFPACHSAQTYAYSLFHSEGDKIPWVSYSGDTLVDLLDLHPILYQSRILLMECTYMGEKPPVSRAREYHHTHLQEILDRRDNFLNEHLVLVHRSIRYSKKDLSLFMDHFLREGFSPKVCFFP